MAWPLAIFRNKKLQVHGSGVPEPYQHTLKRLLVRPTLQVWGIPLRKITLRKDRKDLGEQVFHTHTHTHTHARTDRCTHTHKENYREDASRGPPLSRRLTSAPLATEGRSLKPLRTGSGSCGTASGHRDARMLSAFTPSPPPPAPPDARWRWPLGPGQRRRPPLSRQN